MKLSKISIFIVVLLTAITSCKNKKTELKAFHSYIKAYTSGIISNQDEITVVFFNNISGAVSGSDIEKKVFDFSPSVKGRTYWRDDKTIVFSPDKQLKSDTKYSVKLHLNKILQVPKKLKTFEFTVKTVKQSVNVDFGGLKAKDINDLTNQRLQGELTTSDFAENTNVEKILTATQGKRNLDISWEHSGNRHNFIINDIVRSEKQNKITVKWDASVIESTDKGEKAIAIPSLDDFSVFDIKVFQSPSQRIDIYFTDPLDPNQEPDGLIYLTSDNFTPVTFSVKENLVSVFPARHIKNSVTLIVDKSIRNIMGYNLKKGFSKKIAFENLKPALKPIGKGVIMPTSSDKGLIFPFKAVNLKAVNVRIIQIYEDNIAQFLQNNKLDGSREMRRVGRLIYKNTIQLISDKYIDYGVWNNFSLDLAKLIKTEPGSIYRVLISFDKSQSLYSCGNNTAGDELKPFSDKNEFADYDNPDLYYYDDFKIDYSVYNWSERENPCSESYYMNSKNFIARNILSSNLGIIAKSNENNDFIFVVTDLLTTNPVQGVNVDIYNFQQQLMTTVVTDNSGKAAASLSGKPFLLIAKKDKQRGYLRIDDGSALSMSMFNVSGKKNKKGLKGFIYGERGVWRPGDSIYISFILEDKNRVLPENHPVVFELYSPDNKLYYQKIATNGLNGFYDFRTATKKDDPTGNWLAKISVGGSVFTKYLHIETIKPNRLKINLDFGSEILHDNNLQNGKLNVKWLHGAPAKNIKVKIDLIVSKGKTTFKGYDNYSFDNPSKEFYSYDNTVFSGYTDENGNASVKTKINSGSKSPGMLTAKFKTFAFEESGNFSTDIFSLKYSPYKSYAGVKVPEGKGWNNALFSDKEILIPVVTLGENGNPVDRNKVKIQIYKIERRWWWEDASDYELARYVRDKRKNLIKTDYIDTRNGKALYKLKFNKETWGEKLIIVTDPVSGHSAGKLFFTTYSGWWYDNDVNTEAAEILSFTTNKKSYNTGDIVKVELPSSQTGKAFVSLETGSKILKTFWVDVAETGNKFTFTAEPEMCPNVYINISFIQPHNQTENNLPIRLYGIESVSVENPQTRLHPVLSMPDVLEPNQKVTVKVQEADGKKMTYTIAVVDEGLLDLTRFTTPDVWNAFYTHEALGIKTWDMYKYVMGASSGEMSGLLAIGGDEEIKPVDAKKADRFKPVVKFFGPFELTSGTNKHTFVMPNYVGSVKTMVVAGNNGAYGKTEKTTPVKKPLMVIATMPRVISPGEEVQLPVTVFAMDKKVKKVILSVENNNLLSLSGEKSKTITFTETGDKTVNFKIKVNNKTGVGKLKIIAKSRGEKAYYTIELDVRLPNPPITNIIDAVIEPGKKWETQYSALGVAGTNSGVVEVSRIKPMNLENRLNYLIKYPHGCIEQVTSSVFPQLYLENLVKLTDAQKQDIENNIKAGIAKIMTFSLNNGGLSYWPGQSGYASNWGTSYAGHFLIEAKAKGYDVSNGFMKKWIKYQTKQANSWSASSYHNSYYGSNNDLMQAYRLYTLALAKKPATGAMNRLREIDNLSVSAKWRLAAAYYLAGRKKVADELTANLTTKITSSSSSAMSYSFGSNIRNEAMILEYLTLLGNKIQAVQVVDELSSALSSQEWMSTQTTAFSLLAIAKFAGNLLEQGNLKYHISINNNSQTINVESPVYQHEISFSKSTNGNVSIENKTDKFIYVKIQLTGTPLDAQVEADANNLTMKVKYYDLDGKPLNSGKIYQGTDFIAEVTVHHPGVMRSYSNMVLSQIFPSGWEVHNIRMEGNMQYSGDTPQYQDIRDDRIYTYFDIARGETKIFKVLLNAAYLGKYHLPSVYCEAMYNNKINAHSANGWVEVIKE